MIQKRIIVILKAVARKSTDGIAPEIKVPVKWTKTFDFAEKQKAFELASAGNIAPAELQKAFEASLSPEEQLLMRSYSGIIENDQDLDKVIAALKKLPTVEDVREDMLNVMSFTPNDSLLPSLWAMPKIKALNAWDISRGQGIVVAVCDSGIDPSHPDIAGNLFSSPSNFGWDFSDNDSNPSDYMGHGTHVAGTIAALGNNATGVVGVAFNAKVMSVKIFPNAYNSVCAKAIVYAADHGARLINCSWGPNTTQPVAADPTLKAAIDYAYNKQCFCIFAAGNNNIDCSTQFPANYDKVITVGSTNTADAKSGFSNWGKVVDIAAPGEGILSTKMGGGYVSMQGTSMAAPHVTGAAALLLSLAPQLSFDNLLYFLRKSGDGINTAQYIGGVRLNCYRLVAPAVQTYKRQDVVDTTNGRYALHTSGSIAHLRWTGSAWVQTLISVWGSPVLAGSMIDMGSGRVAAVSASGSMVNTYGPPATPSYAPIGATFGIVAGTLRYSSTMQAYFALNVFNDFVYIKWVNNQWNMNVIPCYAGAMVASSVELTLNMDNVMAINTSGKLGHTWAPATGGVLLSDGSRRTFDQVAPSNGLVP